MCIVGYTPRPGPSTHNSGPPTPGAPMYMSNYPPPGPPYSVGNHGPGPAQHPYQYHPYPYLGTAPPPQQVTPTRKYLKMCFGILGPGRQDPLDPIGPDKPNRRFVFTRDLGKQLQLLIYFI